LDKLIIENNKGKRNITYCFVAQCHNYKKEKISLHHFLKASNFKKQWEIALKMRKILSASMRICSEHFFKT